jgi:hypothetical protein
VTKPISLINVHLFAIKLQSLMHFFIAFIYNFIQWVQLLEFHQFCLHVLSPMLLPTNFVGFSNVNSTNFAILGVWGRQICQIFDITKLFYKK